MESAHLISVFFLSCFNGFLRVILPASGEDTSFSLYFSTLLAPVGRDLVPKFVSSAWVLFNVAYFSYFAHMPSILGLEVVGL